MNDKLTVIARGLVESGSLKFGSFKLKSGIASPYYIDLSWLLSSPREFEAVTNIVADEIREIAFERRINKLASIELKGALLTPPIASKVGLPCIVVRKESKEYGLTGRIVGGEVKSGERFIFFDDVITDGRSKIEGIKPIEEAGGIIDTIVVVVDREQGGREKLEKMGYRVKAISTISEIAGRLLEIGKISEENFRRIMEYLKSSRHNASIFNVKCSR